MFCEHLNNSDNSCKKIRLLDNWIVRQVSSGSLRTVVGL